MDSSDPTQNMHHPPIESPHLTLTSHQQSLISQLQNTSPLFKVYPRDPLSSTELSTASIAIGSNLGDSCLNIEFALRLLEVPTQINWSYPPNAHIIITDTSFLYETTPMYFTNQPKFYNAACIIKTNMDPYQLLEFLKVIENLVGRVETFRNGPRAIDLDILFYDRYVFPYGDDWASPLAHTIDSHKLVVPHIGIPEREFVLRPLNDMIPNFIHPKLNLPLWYLLKKLVLTSNDPISRIIPFPRLPLPTTSLHPSIPPIPPTLTIWSYPTPTPPRIMATLNTTPDSFSNHPQHSTTLTSSLDYIRNSIIDGASIIDIGGYSTRPGASEVSIEEELERVVPVVQAMRHPLNTQLSSTPISIDTFRPHIASTALSAGANCINDVHAFTHLSPWKVGVADWSNHPSLIEMKQVAKKFCCPVVMMHSRGDAGKDKDYGMYDYVCDDTLQDKRQGIKHVLEGVRVELGQKIKAVLGQGGLRRWLIIADPGVGFSKTVEANLGLLKYAQEVVADVMIGKGNEQHLNPLRGLPLLIGASRKSFLGELISQDPAPRKTTGQDRVYATAAAVACAVQQGALVVRVHDVREMMDVVKVTQALGRV